MHVLFSYNQAYLIFLFGKQVFSCGHKYKLIQIN